MKKIVQENVTLRYGQMYNNKNNSYIIRSSCNLKYIFRKNFVKQ